MLLYNTLTEKKEELQKPAKGPLRMFVCGPTVYDYPHIGNARTYVAFDLFVRYLRAREWNVFYLQNMTDVDDRIITRAKESGVAPDAIAKKFERIYHANEKALGITSVAKYARATAYIPEIVKQVQTLIEKGYAYKIEGDGYYFDITKFAGYGRLAKRTVEQAEDGVSRIDESVKKKNKGDFVLWKLAGELALRSLGEGGGITHSVIDGEPLWKTALGWGRPGWHIEDTAITEKFFGPQYDLHGGAVDLKFPHHEAEIAQQEAASGKSPLVKHWMHTGFLLVDGEKMSKSKGNFISIEDFLKKHSAEAFRWMVASHHYRSPMNYSEELAAQAEAALRGVREFFAKVRLAAKSGKGAGTIGDILATAERDFIAALDDDFNTPVALAALFTFMNAAQNKIRSFAKAEAKVVEKKFGELFTMLGFSFKPEKIPAKISGLVKKREALRKAKDFAGADALRKELEGLGYKVEDTVLGPLVLNV